MSNPPPVRGLLDGIWEIHQIIQAEGYSWDEALARLNEAQKKSRRT